MNEENIAEEVLVESSVIPDEVALSEQLADAQGMLTKPVVDTQGLIQSLLFAYGEPLSIETLTGVSGLSEEEIKTALDQIRQDCTVPTSGIELVEVAHKFQLRTKADFAPYLQALKAGAPRRLSTQALETLSVVAYRQPVVKSEVEKIRGVDCTPTIKTLLDRNLIKVIGHQDTVGQPALYATTEEFLSIFSLKSIAELPTLRELSDIISDPGESVLGHSNTDENQQEEQHAFTTAITEESFEQNTEQNL